MGRGRGIGDTTACYGGRIWIMCGVPVLGFGRGGTIVGGGGESRLTWTLEGFVHDVCSAAHKGIHGNLCCE